ncbi:MAG: hypothetical protein Tsb008_21510 [Rhodothalassiaceae bacterium]
MTAYSLADDMPPPVRNFLAITRDFTTLLRRETELLKARRPSETRDLAGEKLRLTSEYRSSLGILRANEQALLGAKDSPIRRRIKEETESFRAELARHAKEVIKLKTVSEGIVRAIGEEAMKREGSVRRYGSSGVASVAIARPAAISIDRAV